MRRGTPDGKPVLVTGGEYRIALSATRALGRRGIPVAVLASSPYAITFHSRYCAERILTPPDHRKEEYLGFLEGLVGGREFSGLLFCDDLAALHVGSRRDALAPFVPFLLPRQEWLELTMNKRAMFRFAMDRGIPAPATVFPPSPDRLAESTRGLRYPLIVKGTRGDSSRHLRVVWNESVGELAEAFRRIRGMERAQGIEEEPFIQEYVSGEVFSAIVLCARGEVLSHFVMRKVLSYPDWGGICVEGESVRGEGILAVVRKVFGEMDWDGIAEIEFIRDRRTGDFRLIEFNPDFNWGIDFAIESGVDFPHLAYRLMRGESPSAGDGPPYPVGRKFLWFLPEGIRYMRRHPASIPAFLMKTLHPGVSSDLCRSDLRALLRQVKRSLWDSGSAGTSTA